MKRNQQEAFERLSTSKRLSGTARAARFLLLLEKEDAAAILRQLSEEEIEKISAEIAKVERVSKEDAEELLRTFDTESAEVFGGKRTAKNILKAAFGDHRAEEILQKSIPKEEEVLSFLGTLSGTELFNLLEKESSSVISLILTQIPAKKAADILKRLTPMQQTEVTKHMTSTKKIASEVMHQLASSLRKKLRTHDHVPTLEIDGVSQISEILRHADLNTRDHILYSLQRKDVALSEKIEASLFTSDLILLVDDRQLQEVLRELEDQQLALFIRGKKSAIAQKILSNVSERRRTLIMEEYSLKHAVSKKKVDDATKQILDFFRRCEAEGRLTMGEETV